MGVFPVPPVVRFPTLTVGRGSLCDAMMQASYKAANEVFDETAAKNAAFKKVFEPWRRFRDEEILWFRVAEQNFDQFMATANAQPASAAKKTS